MCLTDLFKLFLLIISRRYCLLYKTGDEHEVAIQLSTTNFGKKEMWDDSLLLLLSGPSATQADMKGRVAVGETQREEVLEDNGTTFSLSRLPRRRINVLSDGEVKETQRI